MTKTESNLSKPFLAQAQRVLKIIYLPRIATLPPAALPGGNLVETQRSLEQRGEPGVAPERQRPAMDHRGPGRGPDTRQRDLEFRERGPIPRRALLTRLRQTVAEACRVVGPFIRERLGPHLFHPRVSRVGPGGCLPRHRTFLTPRGPDYPRHQNAARKIIGFHTPARREKAPPKSPQPARSVSDFGFWILILDFRFRLAIFFVGAPLPNGHLKCRPLFGFWLLTSEFYCS